MPLLDLLLAMFWFFLFFMWIWLVITVFIDIFRSHDMSGWAKAFWVIFVIVLPLLGVLIYVIARGDKMQQRRIDDAQAQKAAADEYIRATAGSGGSGVADELTKLGQLRDSGALTEEEYQQQKAKLLA
ncbi:MAG: SHOCT domain-containing protein [Ilumatobacteraceae bacterium]